MAMNAYPELRFHCPYYGSLEYQYNTYLNKHADKQNKGSGGSRDSERGKTYKAEWAYQREMGSEIPEFKNIEEAQKFAKKIYKSKTWQKLWDRNRVSTSVNPREPMVVMKQRNSGRGTAGFTNGHTVTLDSRVGLDVYTLIHELTHCLGHMHHGRSFRKTVLDMVGVFLGAEHKKVLKKEFKDRKLSCGEARKPMSFDQWKTSKERMGKIRSCLT
jgi:hypothetical protein